MKHLGTLLITVCLILSAAALRPAGAADDLSAHRSCSQCGMDRKMYAFSRMLITHGDGSSTGVCSLHCAVTALEEGQEKQPASLLVADRNSRELMPAEQAFWVLGGNKRGVMSGRPKWAFSTRVAADAFVSSHGGQVVRWDEALAAAREDAARMQRR
jgi:nitrous oxide reductase accessory protein NosL